MSAAITSASMRIKQQLRALGAPGLVGLAALLLAALLALLGQRWDDESGRLQNQADALRQRLHAQQQLGAHAAPATPQQWWLSLPSASQRQQRLADLLEMGLRLGLVGVRTEHKLSVDPASGLERLRISMPLAGSYAQLRSFIEAALRHDPALSLDSLKLRRNSPQASTLEAELVWSLHGRSAAPADGGPR
jgi:Tfp pilus assembly protein PilO